jgi:hypothetical protein
MIALFVALVALRESKVFYFSPDMLTELDILLMQLLPSEPRFNSPASSVTHCNG